MNTFLRQARRIGLGRPTGVAWLTPDTLLVATIAGLYRLDLEDGSLTPFASQGASLLAVSPRRDRIAAVIEEPRREAIVLSSEGRELWRFASPRESIVYSIGFSADGSRFALGTGDRFVRIYDLADGCERMALGHPAGFSSFDGNPVDIAFSPDGSTLVTCESQGNVHLWDARTGAPLGVFQARHKAARARFLPDGARLAVASEFPGGMIAREDRFLSLHEANGGLLAELDTPTVEDWRGDSLNALAVSPDGAWIAAGGHDESVHVFEAASNRRIAHLTPEALAASAIETGKRKRLGIHSLDFSPDGRHLAVCVSALSNLGQGQDDYLVEVWSCAGWQRALLLEDFVAEARSLCPLEDGRLGVATDEGLRLYEPDLSSFRTLVEGNAKAAAISPDASMAMVGFGSFQGESVLRGLAGGRDEPAWGLLKASIEAVAFHADGVHVAVCQEENASIWKRGRKSVVRRVSHEKRVVAAAASRDGKLGFASWDGTVTVLWNGKKFEHGFVGFAPSPERDRLFSLAFSPDGTKLVVGAGQARHRPGRLYVIGIQPLEVLGELLAQADIRTFSAVAWSPDGTWIAGGAADGRICVWRAEGGPTLAEFRGHGDRISALAHSADGALLYSASHDGSVGVWAQ